MATDNLKHLYGYLNALELRGMANKLAGTARLRIERLHHTLADCRHLRPVVGVDDRCDDVAAERRANLKKNVLDDLRAAILASALLVCVVADLKICAVSSKAAFQRGRDGRSEVAAHMGRTKDHYLRRTLLDQLHEGMAIGLASEHLERRILNEMHDIRTGLEELRGKFGANAFATDQNRSQANAEPLGEFATLAEQFARNVAQPAFFLFGEDPHFALGSVFQHRYLLSRLCGLR